MPEEFTFQLLLTVFARIDLGVYFTFCDKAYFSGFERERRCDGKLKCSGLVALGLKYGEFEAGRLMMHSDT